MKSRRFFALLLCLLLLLQAAPLRASAAPEDGEQHYNIMIVMDCSNSLVDPRGIYSDPQGHRYDATAMFLDLLTETGNNVGAIVFNSTFSTTDASDATMREGLRLNTGLLPMDSDADKENLVNQIRSITPTGYTDIGTALLAAAEQLKGMEAQNGLESIIILFTDGATETKDEYFDLPEKPVYAQSLKNRDAAVELIREEGITLCGVYLRREQIDLENNEVLRLVRDANGFDPSAPSNQVGDLFIHVKEADSLADAFERFYTLVSNTGTKPFQEETDFWIPGIGIEEVNITVSIRGDTLEKCSEYLNNLNVTLVRPDNTAYTARELAAIASMGKSYAVYKLPNPEPGPWKVKVQCPGAQVDTSILLSPNPNLSADVSFSVDPSTVPLKTPFTATARLLHSGTPLADVSDYREYTCTLYVQENADSQKVWPVEMYYDSSVNAYVCQLQLERYSHYNVYAEFACGDSIRLRTPYHFWGIDNERPVADASHSVSITLDHPFSKGIAEVDLYSLVADKEDEDKLLDIRLDYGNYPQEALELNGGILTVDGVIGKSGSVTVIFTDTAGAEAMTTLQIDFTDNLLRNMAIFVIAVLAVLVILGVLFARKWYASNIGGKLPGQLTFKLPVTRSTLVALTVLAQSCVHQSLYDILKENRRILVNNAADQRCSEADVDQFLESHRRELSGIRICAVSGSKTNRTVCRLTGLPGGESNLDLFGENNSSGIPLSGSASIWVEYNRYE